MEHRTHTTVTAYEADATGATLKLRGGEGPAEVRARFVVDCSGHASFLARHFQLREATPRLHNNTRGIYAHFADVPFLEDVLGAPEPRFVCSRDSGTQHHFFDGGWFWGIRFDNGTMSVGLVLDRSIHPDNDLGAEEEFRLFVERFPTVRAHLGTMRPIRPFVKSGRMQFSSRSILGDRFMLTPHASGFVDPLFSSGMDLTLVSGLYRASYHFDVFKQYWRTWVYASGVQYFASLSCPPDSPHGPFGHYGATMAGWKQHLQAMHAVVSASRGEPPEKTARTLKEMMDTLVEPFDPGLSNWEIGSAEVCRPVARKPTLQWFRELVPTVAELTRLSNPEWLRAYEQREAERKAALEARYAESKQQGTRFHKDVDMLRRYQRFGTR